jgi:malonyl-CoA/methylmalonyl-CoA synthetase
VGAALILQRGEDITLAEIRTWGKTRLATYKVPTRVVIVDDLPRNALGKVTKILLKKFFKKATE